MKKDQVVILEKRGVVLVSGEDAKDFLQNIITNDINKVSNKNSIFSALLTCLLYTSPSPRDATLSRMPSSA